MSILPLPFSLVLLSIVHLVIDPFSLSPRHPPLHGASTSKSKFLLPSTYLHYSGPTPTQIQDPSPPLHGLLEDPRTISSRLLLLPPPLRLPQLERPRESAPLTLLWASPQTRTTLVRQTHQLPPVFSHLSTVSTSPSSMAIASGAFLPLPPRPPISVPPP